MLKRLFLILLILLNSYIFGVNDKIFSSGSISPETLAQFLYSGNTELGDELVKEFATIYIEEAEYEGINWDVAFVQMCLETGFLKYGGLVDITQNNFCGLGSFNNRKGASFPTIREGVRAHIQHLKAYSSTENLKNTLLDPRFHFVKRGSAVKVADLAGKWAEDPHYGLKLNTLLNEINVIETGEVVLKAEVPVDIPMGSEFVSEPNEQMVRDESILEEPLLEEALIKGDGWLR